MQPRLTEPCKACDGTGLVARAARRLPNGEPDRLDTVKWPQTICETCNGSGRVPLDYRTIAETAGA
jgi:DnaJ-class molecular chaperone